MEWIGFSQIFVVYMMVSFDLCFFLVSIEETLLKIAEINIRLWLWV